MFNCSRVQVYRQKRLKCSSVQGPPQSFLTTLVHFHVSIRSQPIKRPCIHSLIHHQGSSVKKNHPVSPPMIFILYHHPLHLKLDPLFCPSLIRAHSKVHFCTNTQITFRGISLYVFLMQIHKRLLSCINSQFFYGSNNQVFLSAVIFNFQKKLPFRGGIHLLCEHFCLY